MITVIREEWRVRRQSLFISLGVLALVNLAAIITNGMMLLSLKKAILTSGPVTGNPPLALFFILNFAALGLNTLGFLIGYENYCMKSFKDMTSESTGYLAKMVPVRPSVQLGGRLVLYTGIALAALVVVVGLSWLIFCQVMCLASDDVVASIVDALTVREVSKAMWGETMAHPEIRAIVLSALFSIIVGAVAIAAFGMLGVMLGAAFFKNANRTRWLREIVIVVLIIEIIKFLGTVFEHIATSLETTPAAILAVGGILLVLGAASFAASTWLYEKKVSV